MYKGTCNTGKEYGTQTLAFKVCTDLALGHRRAEIKTSLIAWYLGGLYLYIMFTGQRKDPRRNSS